FGSLVRERAEELGRVLMQRTEQQFVLLSDVESDRVRMTCSCAAVPGARRALRLDSRQPFSRGVAMRRIGLAVALTVRLRAMLRGHIKARLAKKRAEGLSKNSVRIIRATLSVMLSHAVDDGLLMVNPALGINRKGRKSPDTISQADRKKHVR